MKTAINIAIFISGAGSNAKNLICYFKDESNVAVDLVISNKSNDIMRQFCAEHGVEYCEPRKEDSEHDILKKLMAKEIDVIVLAGYLKKIGSVLLHNFKNRIVNIHPSLLPKFGGKGMYGVNVHEAVVQHKETESGITIHLVNEKYDEGRILAQFLVSLTPQDDVKAVETKVRALEAKHFAPEVQRFCNSLLKG